jgi:hypothetical protein
MALITDHDYDSDNDDAHRDSHYANGVTTILIINHDYDYGSDNAQKDED